MEETYKKITICPHCKEEMTYLNRKRHLYLYCVLGTDTIDNRSDD